MAKRNDYLGDYLGWVAIGIIVLLIAIGLFINLKNDDCKEMLDDCVGEMKED